jgi:hypothetical protein
MIIFNIHKPLSQRCKLLPLVSAILLLLVIEVPLAFTQHAGNNAINQRKRDRWVSKTVKHLKKSDVNAINHVIEPHLVELEQFYQLSYRLMGEGLIHFEDGWAYLVSHSFHDNPKIGDITIGIDHTGQIYVSYGHVCGGIIHFITNKAVDVISPSDFFNHFTSDTDGMPWVQIE